MKKLAVFILSSFLISLFLIPSAQALTLYTGDYVTLDEKSPDDVYILAGNTTISEDVNGDLYIAGGNVDVNGTVEEDLVVLGGRVNVLGEVKGDIRIIGGDVIIFNSVGDDVVIAGGKVDIAKKSIVKGSVLASAGYMSIEGIIREDLKGVFSVLFLNGEVDHDVVVTVQENFELSKDSRIGGNLEYSSLIESKVPKGVVQGKVSFNQFEDNRVLGDLTMASIIMKVISFVGSLLLALILVLLAPLGMVRAGELIKEHIFKSFGIGLLTFILAFIGVIILMMTIIGIPLALIILACLLIILYLGKIFTAAWLAVYLLPKPKGRAKKRTKVSKTALFFLIAAALLLFQLVGMIPIVGWIFIIILFFIGVGGIMMLKKEIWEFLRAKKMI